jgi:ribosomal protein S18 acetylase RimI-like enzyme
MSANLQNPLSYYISKYEMLTAPEYWQANTSQLESYFKNKLSNSPQETVFKQLNQSNEFVVGIWRKLDFDTQIFGLNMGRIDWITADDLEIPDRKVLLQEILERTDACEIKHLTYRINAKDAPMIRIAEDAGFRVMTIFTGLSKITDIDDKKENLNTRIASKEDIDDLKKITKEAFGQNTRFHIDPSLSRDAATVLHLSWIENCVNGQAADIVFVVGEANNIKGYITCNIDRDSGSNFEGLRGSIGLFAVSKNAQGQGIGRLLLTQAESWLYAQGVLRVDVGTESVNYSALRAYVQYGFRILHSCVTLHRSW